MSKRKNRNWSNLIANLQSLANEYRTTDIRIRNSIELFCIRLNTENISHASMNTSGKVWGAKSLVFCFCEIFDPVLVEIFHSKTYAYEYLQKHHVAIPLLSQMQHKEQSKMIANNIHLIVTELESLLPIGKVYPHSAPPSDWKKIQNDTENLELVAMLLNSIYSELGYQQALKWCFFCFRMTNKISKYCKVHSSSVDDTAYRKASKVKHSIPSELYKSFKLHQSERINYENNLKIPSKTKILNDLVSYTQIFEWSEIGREWDCVLDPLKYVRKRHKKNALEFTSWQEFANYTKAALQNLDDNTTHPYWIFIMLAEAEQWFTYEDRIEQEKTKQKKDQILEMISQSSRNRDIVNQLQVSNSYVSSLRKQYNKNRTSN